MPIAIRAKQIRGGTIAATVEGGLFCTVQRRQFPAKFLTNPWNWRRIMGRRFRPGRHVLTFREAMAIFQIDSCDRPGGLRKE